MTLKNLSKKTIFFLIITSCAYIVNSLITVVQQYANGLVLSNVENGDLQGMLKMTGVTLLLLGVSFLSDLFCIVSHRKFLSNGTLHLEHNLMKGLLSKKLHSFRKENNGYYLNLISTDAGDTFLNEYLNPIPYLVYSIAAMIGAGFMLFRFSPVLFFVAVGFSFVPILMGNVLTKPLQRLQKARTETSEHFLDTVKQTVDGIEAVKSSGAQGSFLSRFDESARTHMGARMKLSAVKEIDNQLFLDSAGILNIFCRAIGGYLVLNGKFQLSMIYVALSYYATISNNVSNVIHYIVEMRATKPVRDKLAREVKEEDAPDTEITDGGVAEFESVSFGFGERKLYEDFSHTFAKGSCTAIIGESGSGKSTLTKLLRKYYPDYKGTIRISGEEISNLSEEEIYRHVGVVEQSTYLFNASLYDNITMFSGTPAKDSTEYRELLERLNLTALAKQVGDSPLGDFGDKISGGERQRIALARTLRTSPELVLFDEPTTGLDPENVEMINDIIFSMDGITRIVVSHDRREEFLQQFDDVITIGE